MIQTERHRRAWLRAKDNGLSLFEIHNEDEPRFLMTYSCMPKEVGSVRDNATIEEIEEVLNKIDRITIEEIEERSDFSHTCRR